MLTCMIWSRDIRAIGIHANIVGAAGVAVRVFTLDNLVQEDGEKAVSASVWRGAGEIVSSVGWLSIEVFRGGGTRTPFPYR